jgi:lactate dehydrogenase-like 2-hydroxyacid dehydrogenase
VSLQRRNGVIDVLALVPIATGKREDFVAAGLSLIAIAHVDERASIIRASAATVRAVVTSGVFGLNAAEIAALPHLELICTLGTGIDTIDIDAAKARGITITNGAGANAATVADHAMALLLSVVRDVAHFDRQLRAGATMTAIRRVRPGLAGKRIGIIGMGRIGPGIADRAAKGFGMEAGYHNRRPVAGSPYRSFDGIEALAAWADFLVVAALGGPESEHLVDAKILKALGPSGFLVNISRGSLVDTNALIAALRDGTIAGAGLDVVEGEPHVPEALRSLDNVVVTPHMAGLSQESIDAMFRLAITNIRAHFDDRPLTSVVFEGRRKAWRESGAHTASGSQRSCREA